MFLLIGSCPQATREYQLAMLFSPRINLWIHIKAVHVHFISTILTKHIWSIYLFQFFCYIQNKCNYLLVCFRYFAFSFDVPLITYIMTCNNYSDWLINHNNITSRNTKPLSSAQTFVGESLNRTPQDVCYGGYNSDSFLQFWLSRSYESHV